VKGVDGSLFLLGLEPTGAFDVIPIRETAKDQDDVVIVGRIGGSENPWVDGRAAFSIVDLSLLACSDREGDDCPKPWDYCCETDRLPQARALVKFVDEEGKVLTSDARDLFGLHELQTVVVQGTAQRDESGNLTVLARNMFIRSS